MYQRTSLIGRVHRASFHPFGGFVLLALAAPHHLKKHILFMHKKMCSNFCTLVALEHEIVEEKGENSYFGDLLSRADVAS